MQGGSNNPQKAAKSARMLAFTRAIDEYGASFHEFFFRKTKDDDRAKDLSQRFWLSVFKNFKTSQFSHVKLLQHKAGQILIDDQRTRGVRSFLDFTHDVPDMIDSVSHEPSTPEEEERLKTWFWDKFPSAKLTEQKKDIFWLYAHYGYTVKELEAKLSIPHSTIHEWIQDVRRECAAAANSED